MASAITPFIFLFKLTPEGVYMRKVLFPVLLGSLFLFVLVRMIAMGPGTHVAAQTANPSPVNVHGCPSQTGAGGGAEAIPAFVGTGSDGFSPNQSLCLPALAPVPSGASPLAFIVGGLEPSDRVDSQGTVYVESIRGVPGAGGFFSGGAGYAASREYRFFG